MSSSSSSLQAIQDAEMASAVDWTDKVDSKVDSKESSEVVLDFIEHPHNMPLLRKWVAVCTIGSAALCVTCASSVAAFTERGVAEEFRVPNEVAILSISVFVAGTGIGPLLFGPLSEVHGRNVVYRISYVLLFLFSWVVAFAPNIEIFLIFRFITGFCGSAFLSVAGGSVSDLFNNKSVANPMAVYTFCPIIGPVLGPLLSGFINQNLDWRWMYRVQLIWIFVEFIALLIFVPETYMPVLLQKKAYRLRESTGDSGYFAPSDKEDKNLLEAIVISCYKPFQIIAYERMALLLDLWTALILGILYLAFQAFPLIFEKGHGFNLQSTGLSFTGIGLGITLALSSQPYWNRIHEQEAERHGGIAQPESQLRMGEIGGVLVPIGLFWLAFTTYPTVHWIVPIIASVPFGAGIYFVFASTFTYLVSAYRPVAASAMASNSALRSSFAAAFPLFSGAMYERLGTVGATALLAGLATIMSPLPFVFRRIGPRLRRNSRFATK